MKILVLNGPNLNMLGKREPDIYGFETHEDLVNEIEKLCSSMSIECQVLQSNHEGVIVDKIQEADSTVDGVILNPAALTHYSYAVLDAVKAVSIPVIEVHISNIHGREEFRRHSVTAGAACGIIAGFGFDGYLIAIRALADIISQKSDDVKLNVV